MQHQIVKLGLCHFGPPHMTRHCSTPAMGIIWWSTFPYATALLVGGTIKCFRAMDLTGTEAVCPGRADNAAICDVVDYLHSHTANTYTTCSKHSRIPLLPYTSFLPPFFMSTCFSLGTLHRKLQEGKLSEQILRQQILTLSCIWQLRPYILPMLMGHLFG